MWLQMLGACLSGGSSSTGTIVSVNTIQPINTIAPTFAGFGWEMGQMMGYLGDMKDPVFIAAASHLAPSIVRVGGISADFFKYTNLNSNPPSQANVATSSRTVPYPRRLPADNNNIGAGGWWPSHESNFSADAFTTLSTFLSRSGNTLMLTLNELHGRDCHSPKPDCPTNPGCQEWCQGEWDTANVRAFLQHLHDHQLVGGSNPLQYFELGNELVSHLNYTNNTADVIALADIIKDIWGTNVSTDHRADWLSQGEGGLYIPPLIAPSTDNCRDAGTPKIMAGIARRFVCFTIPLQFSPLLR
jgi:hypothetical protein